MFKKTEIFTITLLFIFVFYCALNIGSSWDENTEITRGNERLKYLFSGSLENYWGNWGDKFYPGFYSTLASFFTKMFPKKYEVESFHLINALFSIFTIFGIYRISSNLFNKKVGKIIFLLCFLNPIFFGHMSMNSKDTIIAFAHVWSAYLLLRYLQNQTPGNNCNRYVLLAGFTIGLGTGIRLPFIFTLVPFFFYAIIDIFFLKKITNQKFSFNKFIIHLVIVLMLAYFVAISFWPHAHANIFTEPFKMFLFQIKNNDIFGVPWVLVNGDLFYTNQLPKSYIIINFFYKSPEFILFCYVIFILFMIIDKKFFLYQFDYFWNKILLVLLILLFPIIYFIFLPFRVYDGLRLFLNIIPYFCIIPGLTIYYLIYNFDSRISKILSGFVIISFVYYLFIFFFLTPYQYTYLNLFTGNFSNAHQKFENDYWAISIKELINKIPNETDLISNNKKVKIAFCGVPHDITENELNKLKNFKFEKRDLYNENFDYVIMTNRLDGQRDSVSLVGVETCFDRIKGVDIISVDRNGLILSTLRKKI